MGDQQFTSLEPILSMMNDSDCLTLKRMLKYSLQLEPLHEARDLVQELVAVLKGRLVEGRIYVNDQRIRKHVQEVL